MLVSQLIRDPSRVHSNLKVQGNSLITLKGCKIQFPKHYLNGKLGVIESNVTVLGIYAIIVEDTYYGVNVTCAKQTLTPDSINSITIEGSPYMELIFNPGSVVIQSLDLIQDRPFVFNIYDEIIAKGKTPWYLNYTDLGSLFDTAQYHANVDLKAPRAILEMMSASRARDPKDRAKYYRHSLRTQSDYSTLVPDFIPLRSISYGASNAVAKVLGSYIEEGISSALVTQTDEVEKVESLLLR